MKYYVIDRKGNVWGEAPSMAQAKQIMDDCIADFIRTGLGPEAILFANKNKRGSKGTRVFSFTR